MATAKGARRAFVQGEQWGKETLGQTQDFLAQGQQEANQQIGLGLEYLGQGYDTARGALGTADGYYAPLADRYAGFDGGLYQDALGVRGAEGTERAQAAFKAGPGYQAAFDQGMQGLTRRRAAGGMLNSGNADADAMQFGTGLANQEYSNWLGRLGGLDQQAAGYGLNVANQRAGLQGGLANLASQYGLSQINYGTNPRAQMAIQNAQQQGQLLSDFNTNRTNLYSGAMQAGDAAKNANQANWIGAAKVGAQLLGSVLGGPTGSAMASGMTSAFGNGQAGAASTPGQYTTF